MPTITLDMFTLIAFLACALLILAVIFITGTEFTRRTVVFWLVTSVIVAPFARKFILSIARKLHTRGRSLTRTWTLPHDPSGERLAGSHGARSEPVATAGPASRRGLGRASRSPVPQASPPKHRPWTQRAMGDIVVCASADDAAGRQT